MYLCVTRICKECTLFVRFPRRSYIRAHCIGGEIKYISITSGAKQYRMAKMPFEFPGDEIACNNSPCFSIDHNNIQHFVAGIHFHGSDANLPFESGISAKQQLLPGLPGRVKSSLYLCSPE